MVQIAVLVDGRDRRLGKLRISTSCFAILHEGAIFVRTGKMVRLPPGQRTPAIVFEETEVFKRDKLEPI